MKKIFQLFSMAVALAAGPVLANDAPAGSTPGATDPQASSGGGGSDVVVWVLAAAVALGAVVLIVYVLRSKAPGSDKQREERWAASSRELARISSTLLAALIALMTFLLIVGVQSRIQGFTTELYAAVLLLATGLVLFPLGSLSREMALGGGSRAAKAFRILRALQQLVFVGSVVAVAWFVISYAQLIIKPQPTPSLPQPQPTETQEQPPSEPQQPQAPQPGQ